MNRHGRRMQTSLKRKSGAANLSHLTPVSIQISIPSTFQWFAKFAMDMIEMRDYTIARPLPGFHIDRVAIRNIVGSLLSDQRTWLLEGAIEKGFTHALFVDTDQTFPSNTLHRLLSWHKPIVACNVAVKQIPSFPTARKLVDDKPIPVFTFENSEGLEQVWRVGTGIMLIELAVLSKLEQPWFKTDSSAEAHRHGEDWWFCRQLEHAGIPIYVDHGVSRQVGHLGVFEYHHGHVQPEVVAEVDKMEAEDNKRECESPEIAQTEIS